MKKKLIIALLVLSMLLCGCNPTDPVDSPLETPEESPIDTPKETPEETPTDTPKETPKESPEDTPQETPAETPVETPVETPEVDDGYLDLECFTPSRYADRSFLSYTNEYGIAFSCPYEWKLLRTGASVCYIRRDSTQIGKLSLGEQTDKVNWTVLATKEYSTDGISVTEYIQKSGEGENISYRYKFIYLCGEGENAVTYTLTLNYEEVNPETYEALSSAKLCEKISDPQFNMLENGKNYRSVLIIGNSFVSSSNIGNILKEMLSLNGRSCAVKAISRGNAMVNTYTSDSSVMNDIRNGTYDAVFVCGLYNDAQLSPLETLKSICDTSNTDLILFPAHNESTSVVESAIILNPSLYIIDWKQELDGLILSGVNRWSLCVDDYYDHSKPLAGYVGAHMIYRAMYGEIPTAKMTSSISQSYVDSILGNYVSSGIIPVFIGRNILYFS